jgi:hypothetical protein
MDTESWNVAEERRVRKLQQIRQLLSIALGPDVDLNQEAKNLIAQWKETAAMEIWPPKASAPLQCLLREYHEICDGILDIGDEKVSRAGQPRRAADCNIAKLPELSHRS